MVIVWWSAACLTHCSFLNPSETTTTEKEAQQISEMHQKLQRLQLVNRMGPNLFHDNAKLHIAKPILQKLNELGYKVLPHPPYSPELLSTNYLDNFLSRQKFSTTSRRQKMLSKNWLNSEARNFYATGINKLNSRWQKCVDYNGSYFD